MSQIENEIKKLKRVVMSYHDISHSLSLLEKLSGEITDKVDKYAYEHAFVVTYCRPFSGSDAKLGPAKVHDLLRKSISCFSEDEKKLHHRTVRNRNLVSAHSNSKSYGTTINISDGVAGQICVPASWRYTEFYCQEDVLILRSCCSKLITYLLSEQSRISKSLPLGTYS